MSTKVQDALPAYDRRVLFYKPGPEGGWGKEWLCGVRKGTDANGDYWLAENLGGRVYGVTYWTEFPPLPEEA